MSRVRKPAPPSGDYQVGYGRPPAECRFKPGQSGNPKGRPRKPQDLGSILERALDMRIPIQENGRRRITTMREAIIRGLVNDAARREPKALRMLFALMTRYQGEPGTTRDTSSLATEDQAILADFLAEYGAPASTTNAAQHDGQAADLDNTSDLTGTQTADREPP